MNDEDFIAQIAQFSSLEQMQNIAEAVNESNSLTYLQMQSLNNVMSAGFVGKDVQAVYDRVYVDADNAPRIAYTLSSYAGSVEFEISDESGDVVATIREEDLTAGRHTFTWDGKDDFGNRVPEGQYTIQAVATDASGATFNPDLLLTGTVEAVIYRDGVAYLKVDGIEILLGDITAIGEKGAFDSDG